MTELTDPSRESDSQYERLRAIAWSWRGETGKGIPLRQTGVVSDDDYAGDFANTGSGAFALRASAGSHSLTVNGSGLTLSSGTVAGSFVVGGNLTVNGDTALGNANSDATTITGSLTQSGGAVSLSSPTTVAITATGAGALTATSWSVSGPVTLASALTAQSTAALQGNVTVRNGATGATLALFDVSNTRLLVGSGTALASASNDLFAAIGGRAYVAAGGEDVALGLRYNATAGTYYLGASNSATAPSLVLKGHNGVEVARFGHNTDPYQLTVTGEAKVSSDLTVGSQAVIGATTWSGSEALRVVGTSRLEGDVTVTTGTVAVSTGNIDVQGGTAGEIRVGKAIVGAASLSGTEEFRVVGQSRFEGTVSLIGATIDLDNNQAYRAYDGTTQRSLAKWDSGGVAQFAENGATGAVVDAGYVQLKRNGTVRFEVNATGVGFFSGSPAAKQTVTGAKGGNVALANLLTALANYGLITDSTT